MPAVERREFLKGAGDRGRHDLSFGRHRFGRSRRRPASAGTGDGWMLRGKVAAGLAGAAGGIGPASAVALAGEGADVIGIDIWAPVYGPRSASSLQGPRTWTRQDGSSRPPVAAGWASFSTSVTCRRWERLRPERNGSSAALTGR